MRDWWERASWQKKVAALVVAAIVVAIAVSLVGGCGGKATEPFKDAPVLGHNTEPAEILEMPDGFSNVATKCDGHGHRVYVIFHSDGGYGAVSAIDDQECTGG